MKLAGTGSPLADLRHATLAGWLSPIAVALTLCACLPQSVAAQTQAIEDRRFCSDTAGNVVFYLDLTTPYDASDEASLVSGIGRIFDGLEDGGRIVIRTIEDTFSNSKRLLDMCVPYCKSGGFLSDLFSNCTAGVVINEKKRLKDAIKLAISPVLRQAVELPKSEIIRTMALSAREEYRGGRANILYIFSDMIENSAYLGSRAFFSTSPATLMRRVKKDNLIPNLGGATIHVFGFGRSGVAAAKTALRQDRLARLSGFWTSYFAATGAKLSLEQNLSLAN